jgi:hypothetical protein
MRKARIKPLVDQFGREFAKSLIFPKKPTDYKLGDKAFDNLKRLIDAETPDALVIDPLSSAHNEDENTSKMKSPLNLIDYLMDRNPGMTSIVLHHVSTKVARDRQGGEITRGAKESARGHSSITDWADFNLRLSDVTPGKSTIKKLALDFAKTRHCGRIQRRFITADIANMVFQPFDKDSL